MSNQNGTNGDNTELQEVVICDFNEMTTGEFGMSVSLNNGKKELQQASVSVEYSFNPEVVKLRPTHLLIIEQKDNECDSLKNSLRSGKRIFCAVEEGTRFLNLTATGNHKITILAFNFSSLQRAEKFKKSVLELTNKKEQRHYEYAADINLQTKEFQIVNENAIALTWTEVSIPKELFVQKPRKGWRLLLWKYCHLFRKDNPAVDQCEYRALKWTMIPAAPFIGPTVGIFFALAFLIRIILAIGNALVTFLYWIGLLFFGFKPRPLFEELKDSIAFDRNPRDSMRDSYNGGGYRYFGKNKKGKERVLIVTPFECFAIVISGLSVINFLANFSKNMGHFNFSNVVDIAYFCILLFILARRFGIFGMKGITPADIIAREEKIRNNKQAKEEKEMAEYEVWLQESNNNGRIAPHSGKAKAKLVLRASYWTLKAKLCKPFAE